MASDSGEDDKCTFVRAKQEHHINAREDKTIMHT